MPDGQNYIIAFLGLRSAIGSDFTIMLARQTVTSYNIAELARQTVTLIITAVSYACVFIKLGIITSMVQIRAVTLVFSIATSYELRASWK